MKTHTSAFKTAIKEYGRELDSLITYIYEGETIELGNEELNSITPSYQGSILKSVMKQLIIDSNVEIPVGINLTFQFGVKVRDNNVQDYRDNYDYINYGTYIVKEVEKNEDTGTYTIKCYDKMLYAMQDYEQLNITYPITIRSYINAIASKLGLVFKNASDTFANYDKQIQQDIFMSKQTEQVEENGTTTEHIYYVPLGYTYRDILDQLAQVTASTICINEEDNELELRYITDTQDTIDEEYLKDINVKFGEKYGPINSIVLSRSGESDNVYLTNETSVANHGLNEIKITDNQILNFNDRADYLENILEVLLDVEYYINDFSSTGICYYNLCDKYSISRDNTTYNCVMLNDEVLITQGLLENIHTDFYEKSTTDYDKSDKTDIKLNQTTLIVNKQEGTINALIQNVNNQSDNLNNLTNTFRETMSATEDRLEFVEDKIENGVETLTNTTITINNEGINVKKSTSPIETTITNEEFSVKQGDTRLAYFGYENGETKAEMDNLTIKNYLVTGYHMIDKFDINSEQRTGVFYIGE